MSRNLVLFASLAIAAVPLAYAHDPAGTPKPFCEDPAEWETHDYAPPATGLFIALGQDGNLLADCNGDTIPADYDGHIEWAVGGAWLSAESGDGVTTGSIYCFGEVAHHYAFPTVTVDDILLGTTVPFSVSADTAYAAPPTDPWENCGDFESDASTFCPSSPCSVSFPPGLDGTYQVYVSVSGFAATTDDPSGEAEDLLGHLLFADGGSSGGGKGHVRAGPPPSCCSVNCLTGNCNICCTGNAGNPSCTCALGGIPDCKCN